MVETTNTKRSSSKKWTDVSTLLIGLAVIVLLNFIGGFFFGRFDLTAEKRYTLSDATEETLETLDDVVFVRIYLDGNLPTEFREMRAATKELLDDMRAYAGANLEYEFINPSASPNEEERVEVYRRSRRRTPEETELNTRRKRISRRPASARTRRVSGRHTIRF